MNKDIIISSAILASTVLCASSWQFHIALNVLNVAGRLATSHLKNKSYITAKQKEFSDYVIGGVAFASSYQYLRPSIQNLIPLEHLVKFIVTGFVPMLSINLATYLDQKLSLPENDTINSEPKCIINALKFGAFIGLKSILMPSGVPGTQKSFLDYHAVMSSYAFCSVLYDSSRKDFFNDFGRWLNGVHVGARNAYVAGTITSIIQPMISSNFMAFDMIYSCLKKGFDMY